MASIAPTQDQLQIALRSFLLSILPSGVDVVTGLVNRVAEPSSSSFVVLSPIRFQRLRTNIDEAVDVRFIGSISGTVLTVTDVTFGAILAGALLFGTGVSANTQIVSQDSGVTGGVGVYRVSINQVVTSKVMATGAKTMEQGAEAVVQIDFHTANNTAADMAQIVSTFMRDPAGIDIFRSQSPDYGVVPLYADDPRWLPFINENQQSEWRWVLDAHFQVNQVVSVPQQYADATSVVLKNVDVEFPPG